MTLRKLKKLLEKRLDSFMRILLDETLKGSDRKVFLIKAEETERTIKIIGVPK